MAVASGLVVSLLIGGSRVNVRADPQEHPAGRPLQLRPMAALLVGPDTKFKVQEDTTWPSDDVSETTFEDEPAMSGYDAQVTSADDYLQFALFGGALSSYANDLFNHVDD